MKTRIGLLAFLIASPGAWALPDQGTVAAGNATISTPNANAMEINQSTNKAIINWQSFNIGQNQSVQFLVPDSGSLTLNRVVGGNPSEILGILKSNGQLWLINPNGIMFGANAQVNVAGLMASTLNITDQDFLNGNYQFKQNGSNLAKIVNQGQINADGGYVAFLAPQIENSGIISAKLGTVALAAGTEAAVQLAGNRLLSIGVTQGAEVPMYDEDGKPVAAINHKGEIHADGGRVLMTAKSVNTLLDQSINVSGVVRADSVQEKNGEIILTASGNTIVKNATISARGLKSGEKGGKIKVMGKNVAITDNSTIDVSGAAGGGDMRIGYDNRDPTGPEADITYIDPTTILKAEATETGDGGYIETSGKYLEVFGAQVSTKAANGATGIWLLDPTSVDISNSATTNGSFSGGTFTFTGSPSTSNIQVSNLVTALASNNVIINTASSGAGIGNIIVLNAITSSSTHSLTLTANSNVGLNAAINLTGDLIINAGGTITQNAALTVGGTTTLAAAGGDSTTLGINLSNTSNNFNTVNFSTTASGAGVALADTNGISVTGTTKGGYVSVTSNATGAGTGTLTVGSSGIDTTNVGTVTDGASIYLTDSGIAGSGISLTGNLNTGSSEASQNNDLVLSSQVGNITQSAGAITTRANGNSGFVVTTDGSGAINLNSSTNQILGGANLYFTTAGGNLTLNNSAAADDVSDVVSMNMRASNGDGSSLGDITLTGSGDGLAMAIYSVGGPDGASLAVNNQNGNIYLNDNGDVFDFTGDISVASGHDLSINKDLNTSGGNITLSGESVSLNNLVILSTIADKLLTITGAQGGDGSGSINTLGSVQFNNGDALSLAWASTVGQALGITTTGAITQSAALNVTGTTTLAAGSTNNITLSNSSNNFSTVVITSGKDVSLRDSNALVLGASTVSGTLGVTTSGAITQSGALAVTGASTFNAGSNAITLTNTSNNFGNSAVALTGTTVQIADNNTTGLTLGAVSAGTLTGTATHGLTVNSSGITATAGNITLTANNGIAANTGVLTIAGNINAGTNSITLFNDSTAFATTADAITQSAGTITQTSLIKTITLGIKSGKITQTGGNIVSGGTVKLTNRGGTIGAITLNQNSNNFNSIGAVSFANDLLAGLTVKDVNGLSIGLFKSSGPVSVTANTTTTNTGSLQLSGTLDATGQSVNLTNSSTAGTGTMLDISLILRASDLSLATASGNIVATGAITSTGTTTLSGNNITLNNSTNDFSTVSITSANNVSLRDSGALILGASTVNGTLDITTAGAITQSGAVAVTGTTTLAAGSTNNITLNNTSNNFSTIGITSGNNVSLIDSNALVLGASTVSGTLSVTTGAGGNVNGALTQSGALGVTGTSSFTNSSTSTTAANKAITLTNTGNNFGHQAMSLSGGNLTLIDSNTSGLILGAVTSSGNLTVTASGDLTQAVDTGIDMSSGVGTINTASFNIAADKSGSITLDNTANNFNQNIVSAGGSGLLTGFSLRDSNNSGTYLGDVNAGDNSNAANISVIAQQGFNQVEATSVYSHGGDVTFKTIAGGTEIHQYGAVFTGGGGLLLDFNYSGTVRQNATGSINTFDGIGNYGLVEVRSDGYGYSMEANLDNANNANNFQQIAFENIAGHSMIVNFTGNVNNSLAFGLFYDTAPTGGVDAFNQININTSSANGAVTKLTSAGSYTAEAFNVVSNPVTINAGSGDITLNASDNDFGNQTLNLTGGTININDSNTTGLQLGAINASGLTVNSSGTITLGDTNILDNFDLTAGGDITQSATVSVGGITTLDAGSTHDITLTNLSNSFTTLGLTAANANIVNSSALALGTVSATNLTLTTNGNITKANSSVNLGVTGTTTLAAGSTHNITLNGTNNNFGTFTVNAGNNVSVTDNSGLIFGASTISGNLSVTANGAITQSGALSITGTSTFNAGSGNDIILTNSSNNFGHRVVTLTGDDISLLDHNSTGLILGDVAASGNIDIATYYDGLSPDLTQNTGTAITMTGTDKTANFNVGNGTGQVLLTNLSNNFNGNTINAGQIDGNQLGNVSITDNSDNTLNIGQINSAGDVTLTASGAINQVADGQLNISGLTTANSTGSSVTLVGNGSNQFGRITASSGDNSDITITSSNGIVIQNVIDAGSGTINLTATGNHSITDYDASDYIIAGTTNLTAGSTLDDTDAYIDLENTNNQFGILNATAYGTNGIVIVDGNTNGLNLHTINNYASDANFNVTATGPILLIGNITSASLTLTATDTITGYISQTAGTITATGNSSFESYGARVVSNPPYPDAYLGIDLLENYDSSNQFSSLSIISHYAGASAQANGVGNTTVTGATNNGLFNTQIKNGNLTVGSAGIDSGSGLLTLSINGTGNIALNGNLTSTNGIYLSANGGTITQQAGTTLSGSVSLSNASTATLNNTGALSLGDINVGDLNLMANGSITQVGGSSITTTGTTTLDAGTNDITLANAGNSFGGTMTVGHSGVTAGAITLASSSDITLAQVDNNADTKLSSLTLNAAGGIYQSGAWNVTGITDLTAGLVINLSNVNNDFNTLAITGGNNVVVVDSNAVVLGATEITNDFNLTAGGDITQSAAVSVGGITTLDVGSHDMTLTNASNSFATLGLTAGTAAIVNNGALALGNVSATDFTLTTNGAITKANSSVNLTVSGTTTLAAGSGNNITLNGTNNNFNTLVVTSGNNLTLTDSDALTLGAITVSGNVVITSGEALTVGGEMSAYGVTLTADNEGISDNHGMGSIFSAGDASFVANGTNNDISLTSIDNQLMGDVSLNGNNINFTQGVGDLTLDQVIAQGDITILNQSGTLSFGGNLPIQSVGDVTLVAEQFINNYSGSDPITITGGGRWLFYLTNYDGNTFGTLTTSNAPIWDTAYPTAITESGNRYVFAVSDPTPPPPPRPPGPTPNTATVTTNAIPASATSIVLNPTNTSLWVNGNITGNMPHHLKPKKCITGLSGQQICSGGQGR